MSKLDNLSIADIKALLDFVNESKKERLEDLKHQGIKSTKDDKQIHELEILSFHLHTRLFTISRKLLKEIEL